jgi:DNA-binding NarL/FixJ family response regulator
MRDLDAVADKLGLERFALAGIQAGGNLAVHYAARFPERVTKLILRDWAPNFATDSEPVRVDALRQLMERDWEMFTENIGRVTFGFRTAASEGYGRLVRASLTQEMALRYGRRLLREDCYPLLPRIQCATLILHSEPSAYSSITAARAASAAIPNSRLRVFEGDLPDRIDQIVAAIADFIAPEERSHAKPGIDATPPLQADIPSPTPLTAREMDVLQLVVRGLSNREMAAELVLSPRTVERHLENIYRKTGARNRVEVAAYAVGAGLAQAPVP